VGAPFRPPSFDILIFRPGLLKSLLLRPVLGSCGLPDCGRCPQGLGSQLRILRLTEPQLGSLDLRPRVWAALKGLGSLRLGSVSGVGVSFGVSAGKPQVWGVAQALESHVLLESSQGLESQAWEPSGCGASGVGALRAESHSQLSSLRLRVPQLVVSRGLGVSGLGSLMLESHAWWDSQAWEPQAWEPQAWGASGVGASAWPLSLRSSCRGIPSLWRPQQSSCRARPGRPSVALLLSLLMDFFWRSKIC